MSGCQLEKFAVCSCSIMSNTLRPPGLTTPWTAAHQAPLSMGILQARILEWFDMPSSRDLPDQGWNPGLLYAWGLSLLSELPAPNKIGLEVYRRCVICLLLLPAIVGFLPANISVPFLFTWKLSRMQVLSKRKTLAQKELLSGIAVKILSSCQFIQSTRGWVFAFNYNIYLRKNKWLASFCHVWYSINSNFRAVGVHL